MTKEKRLIIEKWVITYNGTGNLIYEMEFNIANKQLKFFTKEDIIKDINFLICGGKL